jgi:hypothetical protein
MSHDVTDVTRGIRKITTSYNILDYVTVFLLMSWCNNTLRLNRCTDGCAYMSGHCQHISTAKTCAAFAYLGLIICSECHKIFNHEAAQSSIVPA